MHRFRGWLAGPSDPLLPPPLPRLHRSLPHRLPYILDTSPRQRYTLRLLFRSDIAEISESRERDIAVRSNFNTPILHLRRLENSVPSLRRQFRCAHHTLLSNCHTATYPNQTGEYSDNGVVQNEPDGGVRG